jgi:hypothetical protein
MLERPEVISDFYLSTLLAQLQTDGYDVFVVTGTLPPVNLDIGYGMGHHFKESDLLRGGSGSTAVKPTVVDPWAALGKGQVLSSSSSSSSSSAPLVDMASYGSDDDESNDIAAAIAMSLSEPSSSSLPSSSSSSFVGVARELPPEAQEGESGARIMIRGVPNVKLVRKFRSSDHASFLFDWIDNALNEQQANNSKNYELVQMNTVLRRHELLGSCQSFSEAGLVPSSALMIKFL